MKRTLLALAIASISLAAFAGPPTDKPPVGPIDVSVVNQPIAVMPVPTWTSSAGYWEWSTSDLVTGTTATPDETFDSPVILTGVMLRLQMPVAGEPLDRCFAAVSLEYDDEGATSTKRLAAAQVLNGNGVAEIYVPLPDIYADTGSTLGAVVFPSDTEGTCVFDILVQGVAAD